MALESNPCGGFAKGDLARVHALRARPDLNGRLVVLIFHDPTAERWAVRFAGADPSVKIRPSNLVRVDPASVVGAAAAGKERNELAGLLGSRRTMEEVEEAATDGPRIRKRGIDFRLKYLSEEEAKKGQEKCTETLIDLRSRMCSDNDAWYVYVRRGRTWTGSYESKRRLWFISVARRPNIVYTFITDGPHASDVKAPIPVSFVCGCLASVMEEDTMYPSLVACCPLGTNSTRAEMAADLATRLNSILSLQYLPVETVFCRDLPHSYPGSVLGLGSKEAAIETGAWMAFMERIEQRLEHFELTVNSREGNADVSAKLSGYIGSSLDPRSAGDRLNRDASVAEMRELFDASRVFHEEEPWDVLSNQEYLHLRDVESGEETWVMVCGHTDYEGRGLNVFQSFDDLQRSFYAPRTAPLRHGMHRLQYQDPQCTSFGTLDSIVGLDLPLATNDLRGQTIPLWYTTEPNRPTFLDDNKDVDAIVSMWSKPPPHTKWISLAKVTRATVLYASDPRLVNRVGSGNVPLRMTMNMCMVFSGLQVTGGIFDRPQPRMSLADQVQTMSIGDPERCNFCNKPTDYEMQVDCKRCNIRYCSKRCRDKDRSRHAMMCK